MTQTSDDPISTALSDSDDFKILSDAAMFAEIEKTRQIADAIDQGIEQYKQVLSQLRQRKRKHQRACSAAQRIVRKMQKRLEKLYGHCFDLRGKEIDWPTMVEWLETNVSGRGAVLGCLVAIEDPDAAFYFKVRWL